jgi:hypothetical protein
VAIDGRDIARARAQTDAGPPSAPPPGRPDAYESPFIRVLSHAIVWIPVALVIGFAYWSGTWMGGWMMGVLSVVSTAATVGILWIWYKSRRRGR